MPSVGEEFAGDDCCGPNLFMHQRLSAARSHLAFDVTGKLLSEKQVLGG
jgi:hypothetical protein